MNSGNKKRIGLLFGSFNPVHNGHVALGRAALDENLVDEVWYVVSPHNPDKPLGSLASFEDRMAMVRLAIDGTPNMMPSDIEDELPRPSYTFHTLRELRARYPEYSFSIIAGDDILRTILSWHEGEEIVHHHDLIVRNRSAAPVEIPAGIRASFLPGFVELSATDVRGMIGQHQDANSAIPNKVRDYIEQKGLYK